MEYFSRSSFLAALEYGQYDLEKMIARKESVYEAYGEFAARAHWETS